MPTYSKNFLKEVILKLEYDKVSNFSGLVQSFSERYPIYYRKQIPGKMMVLSDTSVQLKDNNMDVYTYESQDSAVRIELTDESVVVQYSVYLDKEKLLEDLTHVSSYISSIGITEIKRIGLRYINVIENGKIPEVNIAEYSDITNYVSPLISQGLDFLSGVPNINILRSMSESILKFPDIQANLIFKYGFWNNNFPKNNLNKEFVLDYDCVSLLPIELVNPATLNTIISSYNDKVYSLFDLSITDNLKSLLT